MHDSLFNDTHLVEKSYTFPFKYTSLNSVALNPLHILSRQNWVRKFAFFISALNLKILLI